MERLVSEGQSAEAVTLAVDFTAPRQRLAELREDSIAYLGNALDATQIKP